MTLMRLITIKYFNRLTALVKTIINWGMWRVFSNADGEIVGLVHASRRERDGTYEACSLSHCVFSTAFN